MFLKISTILTLIFTNRISAECSEKLHRPRIILTTSFGDNTLELESEYVVPKNVEAFTLNCSHHAPIDWTFEGVMANTLVSFETGQTYTDFWVWGNNCYYMALRFTKMDDQITGNYKCFSRIIKEDSKSVNIFPDGSTLVFRGKTIQIAPKFGVEELTTTVELPCAVNNPKSQVQLRFKSINEEKWMKISNEIVSYNPTMGYKISVHANVVGESGYGIYKCQVLGHAMNSDEGSVFINVTRPPAFKVFPDDRNRVSNLLVPMNATKPYSLNCFGMTPVMLKVINPASRSIGSITENVNTSLLYPYGSSILLTNPQLLKPSSSWNEVQCIANTSDDPIHTWKFKWTKESLGELELDAENFRATCTSGFIDHVEMIYTPCDTLTECQFKHKCFEKNSGPSCASKPSLSGETDMYNVGKTKKVIRLPRKSGVVSCFSPDVESTKFFYATADGKRLSENVRGDGIPEVITFSTSAESLRIGDMLSIECSLVQRLFIGGPFLIVVLKNGTQNLLPAGQIVKSTNFTRLQGKLTQKVIIQITTVVVKAIYCQGVYANREVGVKGIIGHSIDISVEARGTLIRGKREENVTFYNGNNGTLTCVVEAFPLPSVTWIIPPNAESFVKYKVEDGEITRSSTLIFKKQNPNLNGTYTCETNDENGTIIKKVFNVNFVLDADRTSSNDEGFGITPIIIGVFVGVFVLLFVGLYAGFCLRKRNRHNLLTPIPRTTSLLSQSDITGFLEGNQGLIGRTDDVCLLVQRNPYDKNYDILLEHLEIDQNIILGQGAYGMVMKGRIKGGKFESSMAVAVKTVLANTDKDYIKSLLTELKVMIYVGKNKYVVDLIGACTDNLSQNQLYIVIQLYPQGSLDTYLRNGRRDFVNQIVKGSWDNNKIEQMYVNTKRGTSIYTVDLIRWSYQITRGMEYLASIKVIHGDLAVRNVLLDEHLVAKISDFGLARQLYEYTQYVKKQQTPLPWRYLAIESLRDMTFSTKSDVWAFGVTLWEIMSLAETPYPGQIWNPQFIKTLEEGYRMSKPKYAPSEMYDMMVECWRENPEDRGEFPTLAEHLLEIIETHFPAVSI